MSVACHCHSSCPMLSPGNVIIATGMATISDVHQNFGHHTGSQSKKEECLLTTMLQTHKKELSFMLTLENFHK